jgi:fluoride ion exporter CrcB/FEX
VHKRLVRTLQLALVAVLATAGIGLVASPAMADTTCSNPGFICAWTDANYTGSKMLTNFVGCQNIASPWGNNITSLKVNASPSNNDWVMYFGTGCTGGFITYSNGTSIADLASAADNMFSSMKRA